MASLGKERLGWDLGKEFLPGRVGRGWAGIPRFAVAVPGSLECPRPGWTLGTVGGVPAMDGVGMGSYKSLPPKSFHGGFSPPSFRLLG